MKRRRINRGRQRKQELREKATELELLRFNRTAMEQLAVLDTRLGPGLGATKERFRLQRLIDEPKNKKTKKTKKARGNKGR